MIIRPRPMNTPLSPPPPPPLSLLVHVFNAPPPTPHVRLMDNNKVWFSWQIDVDEVSVQLSQRPPPPRLRGRMDKVAPGPSPSPSPSPPPSPSTNLEHGHAEVHLRPTPLGYLGRQRASVTDGGREGDCSGAMVVLRLVVSGARARVGTRTQKGFVMNGSVHAVEASGVGGITCLSINPGALWGGGSGGGGGNGAGRSLHGGKGANNDVVAYGRTCRLKYDLCKVRCTTAFPHVILCLCVFCVCGCRNL